MRCAGFQVTCLSNCTDSSQSCVFGFNPARPAGLLKDSQSAALARWKRGLDQKAFAFDCEIGRTQLYMNENGETNPRLLTLIKISSGLEILLSELVKV